MGKRLAIRRLHAQTGNNYLLQFNNSALSSDDSMRQFIKTSQFYSKRNLVQKFKHQIQGVIKMICDHQAKICATLINLTIFSCLNSKSQLQRQTNAKHSFLNFATGNKFQKALQIFTDCCICKSNTFVHHKMCKCR